LNPEPRPARSTPAASADDLSGTESADADTGQTYHGAVRQRLPEVIGHDPEYKERLDHHERNDEEHRGLRGTSPGREIDRLAQWTYLLAAPFRSCAMRVSTALSTSGL